MPNTTKPEPQPILATPAARLLQGPIGVINVGLEGFATELAAQGQTVCHVDWSPPAGGDEKLAALLAKLGL